MSEQRTITEVLDTELLHQYLEMLGRSGLAASLATFGELMPGYAKELNEYIQLKQEQETRRQAHKVKGSCHSLGFKRLAEPMRFIEQETWQWAEVRKITEVWKADFETDYEDAVRWLRLNNDD